MARLVRASSDAHSPGYRETLRGAHSRHRRDSRARLNRLFVPSQISLQWVQATNGALPGRRDRFTVALPCHMSRGARGLEQSLPELRALGDASKRYATECGALAPGTSRNDGTSTQRFEFGRSSGRPASVPVVSPSRSANTPFTNTWTVPAAYWCGAS